MKQKSLTLKDIGKNWWWKRKDIRRYGVKGVDWPVVKEAARNYELMRRSAMGAQFTQTYLELDREGKTMAHTLWVNWAQAPYRHVTDPKQYDEIGWTPIYENQHRQWNLRLAIKKLTDEFIREIKTLQKIQKIPIPRRNKGEKHRGVSWKYIEVLDRKLNGIGKFNDSQRHMLSVARRRAKKFCFQYKRALAKWHKGGANPDSDFEDNNTTEQPFM